MIVSVMCAKPNGLRLVTNKHRNESLKNLKLHKMSFGTFRITNYSLFIKMSEQSTLFSFIIRMFHFNR